MTPSEAGENLHHAPVRLAVFHGDAECAVTQSRAHTRSVAQEESFFTALDSDGRSIRAVLRKIAKDEIGNSRHRLPAQ